MGKKTSQNSNKKVGGHHPQSPSKTSKKKVGHKKDKEIKENQNECVIRNLKRGILSIALSILVVAVAIMIQKYISSSNDDNNSITQHYDGTYQNTTASTSVIEPEWQNPMPRVQFFISRACEVAYCHPALKRVSYRLLRAESKIPIGETLFEIPRSMQIWDLDALRDPFVREHLFHATHTASGNRLGSEAYLAAYLALQKYYFQSGQIKESDFDPIRIAYLDMLPTTREFSYHPLMAQLPQLQQVLGASSSAYNVVESYGNMVMSEFDAFSTSSPEEFTKRVTAEDYFVARLIVMTRAVQVGSPGVSDVIQWDLKGNDFVNQNDLLDDELHAYKDLLGIDLKSNGCIAMVPLADLFNHHPHSNAEFDYMTNKPANGSFVVTTQNYDIEEGSEPMANYGTMADSHLFARYGFVNGDGSGHTQIDIAHHHTVLRLNISDQYDYLPHEWVSDKFQDYQLKQIASYIRYDDGFEDCIPGRTSHPEEAKLKDLKLKHLAKIANKDENWIILMPPRNPNSMPSKVSQMPITPYIPIYDEGHTKNNYNIDNLLETCRLISLVNDDYDGQATQVLEENFKNDIFVYGEGGFDLEIRALFCVGRLVGTTLLALESQAGIKSFRDQVEKETWNAFRSMKWASVHVRFGEMQALEVLGNLIVKRIESKWPKGYTDAREQFKIRSEPCPDEYMNFLFEEDKEDPLMPLY